MTDASDTLGIKESSLVAAAYVEHFELMEVLVILFKVLGVYYILKFHSVSLVCSFILWRVKKAGSAIAHKDGG